MRKSTDMANISSIKRMAEKHVSTFFNTVVMHRRNNFVKPSGFSYPLMTVCKHIFKAYTQIFPIKSARSSSTAS